MKRQTGMVVGLFAAIAFLQTGCGANPNKVLPVEVKLTVEGMAPVGATVVLQPVDSQSFEKPKPVGKVGKDGAVRFSTFKQDDGAPAGEYIVTVVLYQIERDENGGKIIKRNEQLKSKHSDPNNADAPRIKVERGKKYYAPIDL
jgi:hypothetical protein